VIEPFLSTLLTIQVASIMPDAEGRYTVFRIRSAAVLTAFALMVLAFLLAQWPPVRRASSISDLETVSVGLNLLIAGALPWLLQWGALALICASLTRQIAFIDRSSTVAAMVLPLAVGGHLGGLGLRQGTGGTIRLRPFPM